MQIINLKFNNITIDLHYDVLNDKVILHDLVFIDHTFSYDFKKRREILNDMIVAILKQKSDPSP